MAEFYSATVRLFDRFCGPVLLRNSHAQLGVTRDVILAQLFRIQIDLGEQAAKGAGEGLVLDILEALLQRVQQFAVLSLFC